VKVLHDINGSICCLNCGLFYLPLCGTLFNGLEMLRIFGSTQWNIWPIFQVFGIQFVLLE